jgi:hypothetical protein
MHRKLADSSAFENFAYVTYEPNSSPASLLGYANGLFQLELERAPRSACAR